MEAGQLNRKVAFIIQARMQSTRLPGKILLPIPFGKKKPLLLWIIEELRKSDYNSDIIIATSKNKENNILQTFCEKNEVKCFRGKEEDVLSRFTSIIKESDYNCIVRLTADNPIIDINILDKAISYHLKNKNDYTNTESLPVGMNIEIVSVNALLDVEKHKVTMAEKEHVTLFIKNNNEYKKEIYSIKVKAELKKLRLTIDYPSDYLVISSILSLHSENDKISGLKLVEKVFLNYPFVFEVNQSNFQKRQFASNKEELDFALELLQNLELNNISNILRNYKDENHI